MGVITNKSNFTASAVQTTGTATCASNAATLNTEAGVITSESLSTAADASQSLTITNSKVTATSVVLVSLCNYAGTIGTNGIPVAVAQSVGSGSFVIRVSNVHSANALSGAVKVAFQVLTPIS